MGCLGSYPAEFGISLRMETPDPLSYALLCLINIFQYSLPFQIAAVSHVSHHHCCDSTFVTPSFSLLVTAADISGHKCIFQSASLHLSCMLSPMYPVKCLLTVYLLMIVPTAINPSGDCSSKSYKYPLPLQLFLAHMVPKLIAAQLLLVV